MTLKRIKDTYEKQIYDFLTEIYIFCPSCQACAIIKAPKFSFRTTLEFPVKLICTACGYNKSRDTGPSVISFASSYKKNDTACFIIGAPVDPYFHHPLWLSINCCDTVLWAYNFEHLAFVEKHVEAKLRERNTSEMKNNNLGSRLPKWMSASKNRRKVLKAINQLKEKK